MASNEKRKKANDCRVALGAELVLGGAAELHAQLGGVLAEAAPVVLDAAAVTRLDTCALQLLHAFVQERGADKRACRWENVGAVVHEAAAQLGLEKMLELPEAVPAIH